MMDTTAAHALIRELRELRSDHGRVEAKRARGGMPKEMWRSIVAVANSHGGVVLLGVDETSGFSVTGIDDPASLETRISELCSSEIEPPVRAQIRSHQINGAWVVTVEVPELDPLLQPAYYKPKGLPAGATIRVGDGSRQLTSYEAHLLLSRRGQPEDELRPITEATRADLDPDALDNYIRHMRSSRPRAFGGRDDAAVLRMTKILVPHDDDLVPSVAGLLAFGTYPQQFLPQVNATFVAYPDSHRGAPGPGGERFLDNAAFDGPIPVIVDDALRRVRANMKRRAVVHGASRTNVWEYPVPALREAIVNALVHRDLSAGALGTQVQIEFYPDRVIIRNPGGLLGTVDPSQLLDIPVSSTRNPTLLRILEDVPLAEGGMVAENRGSGLAVIAESLRRQGNPPPEFVDSIAVFEITFRTTSAETNSTASQQDPHDIIRHDAAAQQIMDELGGGPLSRRELAERTGLAAHTIRYRLNKLRQAGRVRLKGNPRDPRGKWEITPPHTS